jgi:hypothetical protein
VRPDPELSEVIEMARLNRSLIGLAAIGWALAAAPLHAATHPVVVQFIPALPVAGQTVTARLSNGLSNACWPPATSVTQVYAEITLRLDYSDTCAPQNILPWRDYVLGAFPAGNYTLIVNSCSHNPPPFPTECNIVLRAPFAVLRPVEPAPGLTGAAMVALIAGLIAAAGGYARALRRRRRN